MPTHGHLDGVVGQHPLDESRERRGRPLDAVGLDRADIRDRVAEVAKQLQGACAFGIGDARLGHDVNDRPGPVRAARCSGSIVWTSTTGSTSTSAGNAFELLRGRSLPRSRTRGWS